ncbi:MAG: glycosyltransferase family 4 protein [Ilumatobacter sp.]
MIRVAYSVEQCWHEVPGGTAVAALRVAREFQRQEFADDVDLRFVAGKHAAPPAPDLRPVGQVAMLPLGRPLLYEGWTRLNWPRVESVTGPVDVVHATGLIPCATGAPLVVSVHDVAFLHDPAKFTRHGVKSMTRALGTIRKRAALVIVPSRASFEDCIDAGLSEQRLRLVTLGVDQLTATVAEVDDARRNHDLPPEFVLFVGTVEPRKNLHRLVSAMAVADGPVGELPLVIAGSDGWGDARTDVADTAVRAGLDVRFLGYVSEADLRGLYASASVVAYPSEREGFGLPVAEAMTQGAAVVTSRGTSTEEVAGGAAVLVDPFDVDDIARGLDEAHRRGDELAEPARARAAELDWAATARSTLDVYREVVT